jgi:hypothetical protein
MSWDQSETPRSEMQLGVREVILREAVVPGCGLCHLASTTLNLPPRRGVDLTTGQSLGTCRWDYPASDYAERACWVIRYGLADGRASGCDCTHALDEAQAIASWDAFLRSDPPKPAADHYVNIFAVEGAARPVSQRGPYTAEQAVAEKVRLDEHIKGLGWCHVTEVTTTKAEWPACGEPPVETSCIQWDKTEGS